MRYLRKLLVGVFGAASLLGAGSLSVAASGNTLIEFDSMSGVTAAQTNTTNDRGLTAGGAPWVIKSGRGSVNRHGEVDIRVRGLIIPVLNPPHNPLGTFSAAVSCLTPEGVMNVVTGPVPTGLKGNARFDTTVTLPSTCNSPEVFVGFVKPNGQFIWFAQSIAEGDE